MLFDFYNVGYSLAKFVPSVLP